MHSTGSDRLLYPVAHSYRGFAVADDLRVRRDAAHVFLQTAIVTLGTIAVCWSWSRQLDVPALANWEQGSKALSWGHWRAVAQAVAKRLPTQPGGDPYARLSDVYAEAGPSLDQYLPLRNVEAHGGQQRADADIQLALAKLEPLVEQVYRALSRSTWLHLAQVVGVSQTRRQGLFTIRMREMAGSDPQFSVTAKTCCRTWPNGALICYPYDELEDSLELSRLLKYEQCDRCSGPELFYLTRARKNRTEYRSIERGHLHEGEIGLADIVSAGKVEETINDDLSPTDVVRRPRPNAVAPPPRDRKQRGWRAVWPNLASVRRRIGARVIDLFAVWVLGTVGRSGAALINWADLVGWACAIVLALIYEPTTMVIMKRTVGQRLLQIEPISVWTGRILGPADALRRGFAADLQYALAPVVINMYWLLRHPARQTIQDVVAGTVVVYDHL